MKNSLTRYCKVVAFVVLLGLAGGADRADATLADQCRATPPFQPWAMECHKTFTATTVDQDWQALGQDWSSYSAVWTAPDGHQFLATGGDAPYCRLYGQYGIIRVKENHCDGNLVVSVRVVSGPSQSVRFDYEDTQ